VISGLGSGTYNVYFVNSTGCQSLTVSSTINNPGAPIINDIPNTTVCDSYTLPLITGSMLSSNESYWTGTGGTGTQYFAGDPVTLSGTYYIYDINGTCSDEENFILTVNATPSITNPGAQTICSSYTLGTITGTNLSGNEAYYNNSQALGGTVISGAITSTQTVWIYDANGTCSDEESFVVTINQLPTVTSVTGGGTYCMGDVVNDIMVATTGSANWTIDYTLNGVGQTATGSASPISLGNAAGVYVVVNITDANCTNSASGTQTITINPIPIAPTAGTDSVYCSNWTLVPLTASGTGGTMTWYSDAATTNQIGTGNSFTPNNNAGVTIYYVTETAFGCEGPASAVTITINDCEIVVPTAFTPDGDLVNDVWEIVDLDAVYPDNVVTVFNRWGNKLYESEKGAYATRPWDGTYNGDALPVGSYYFIIDFNEEDVEPRKGVVSIILN
jgi:gliding motility-associated-like protein